MKRIVCLVMVGWLMFFGVGNVKAQNTSQYLVGEIVSLDAESGKATVKDLNTGEKKAFNVGNQLFQLSLGDQIVLQFSGDTVQSIKFLSGDTLTQTGVNWPNNDPFNQRVNWDPLAEMAQMQRRMNEMFDVSFMRGSDVSQSGQSMSTEIDSQETDKEYIYKMSIPGMSKDSINVEVKQGMLIISGNKEQQKKQDNPSGHFQSMSYGSFSRAISVPKNANTDKMDVKYDKDILTIRLPKK